MSSALIRQALEFLDKEGAARVSGKKRRAPPSGQERRPRKNKAPRRAGPAPSEQDSADDTVRKLLALSKPAADQALTEKLVARAVKGKPLSDFIPVSKEPVKEQSILFPEETFEDFEAELFTS